MRRLVVRADGPRTAELARVPAPFGIGQVPARLAPDRTTSLVCGYCSVGCSLDVHLRDGQAVSLSPSADHPVNRGSACPKGWEALTPMTAADRATEPLLRDRHGRLRPVGWEDAARAFARRMKAVQADHGPGAVAVLGSGQLTCEDLAAIGLFARAGMGVLHADGNTRQCMATSVVAHRECFGFDAPPFTYADLEESDVVVLVGANPCIAHPILWERLQRNRHDPTIVVVDPRHTETAGAAHHHVALAPKSDLAFLYGLGHVLVRDGLVDHGFVARSTTGYGAWRDHVAAFTPERVSHECGVPAKQVVEVAHLVGRAERCSLWWTMGVNQGHQAVRTAQAVVALALATGNIGRPGTGANSITGQCNAMGSRLFSGTSTLWGGRDWRDAGHRADAAAVLGIDPAVLPAEPGLAYDQIVEAIAAGDIRALWVIGTNGAHSWVNQGDLHDLLGRLDLLVVQDLYADTETARFAHLVLPAAGWSEKEGTYINSERRIGLVKRVRRAPGKALADGHIVRVLAEAWGCGDLFRAWTSPEAVFGILQRLSAGMPCDFTGIPGYSGLEEAGGVQWPLPAGAAWPPAPERRLFEDGRFPTPDGRARFVVADPVPPRERPGPRRPLVLLTGRGSAAEWHTGTRTRRSPVLAALAPSALWVEVHPQDASARGIAAGDAVLVRNDRGRVSARAHVTPTVQPGTVFLPMHHPDTNRLTFPEVDPLSRQPSFKHAAVEVERA